MIHNDNLLKYILLKEKTFKIFSLGCIIDFYPSCQREKIQKFSINNL